MGWTTMQVIQFNHEERTIYYPYFTDKNFDWLTAKVHAKNNTLATIRNDQDIFQWKEECHTNSCVLSTLKN